MIWVDFHQRVACWEIPSNCDPLVFEIWHPRVHEVSELPISIIVTVVIGIVVVWKKLCLITRLPIALIVMICIVVSIVVVVVVSSLKVFDISDTIIHDIFILGPEFGFAIVFCVIV